MVKLPTGGRFFYSPTAANPRLVDGESLVGMIQGGGAVRLPFSGCGSHGEVKILYSRYCAITLYLVGSSCKTWGLFEKSAPRLASFLFISYDLWFRSWASLRGPGDRTMACLGDCRAVRSVHFRLALA